MYTGPPFSDDEDTVPFERKAVTIAHRTENQLTLKRPWRRYVPPHKRDRVFVMAKRNYKVYADIGSNRYLLCRKLAILDTGAGPNFIRISELDPDWKERIRHGPLPCVNDANDKPLKTVGTIEQIVRLGNLIVKLDFIVCESLAASVILGADFCDRFIEAIYPRKKSVELDDGSTVPIVRRPLSRPPTAPPLPKEQEYRKDSGRTSPSIRVEKATTLAPGTQTFVSCVSQRHGTMIIEPIERLYENHLLAPTNGVVHVEPNRPFRILIANFGSTPKRLCKNQVVGNLLPHPPVIVPTHLQLAHVLGLEEPQLGGNVVDNVATAGEGDETPKQTGTPDSTSEHPRSKHPSIEDIDLSHVDEPYRTRLCELLSKYSSMWSGALGEITLTEHRIDLKEGSKPLAQQPYRAGFREREVIAQEVEKMLRAGVIEPAMSAWASPVVLVPKPDGSSRFCVDYRRLNGITVRDSYPLPRMDDYLDSLGEARVFTTLDCNSGYWQIPIREADRNKTAFTCHSGMYQFIRMPFGLTNAPATFQRTIDILLSRFKWQTCLVYLDDIIIFSKDKPSHLHHLSQILKALHRAGVTIKLSKCTFFKDSVKYLGHIIRPGTLEIDTIRTKALKEAKHPRNKTELRSFLGLCNVYRRFVPRYATVAAPLTDLLKKGTPDELPPFGISQSVAFNALIEAVTAPPVLALPKPGLRFILDTDACDYQIGCALFQLQEGEKKPIGYWSRTLQPAERNYCVTEKECLSAVWAMLTLRPYLLGDEFVLNTDHYALKWLMTVQNPSGRLLRWRLRLCEFHFVINYAKGSTHVHADALSRLQTLGETETDVDDDLPCLTIEAPEEHEETQHEYFDSDDILWDNALATPEAGSPQPQLVPITREELLREQHTDEFCAKICSRLDEGGLSLLRSTQMAFYAERVRLNPE